MNKILKKFLLLSLILVFVDAAPAGVNESTVTMDVGELPTETTPTTTDAGSTMMPSIKTTATDSSQNEVDVKFAAEDLKTATVSDIDEKIESIKSDGAEKKIEEAELRRQLETSEISTGSALPVNEKLIELTTENVTKENIQVTTSSTVLPTEGDVTTSAIVEKAEKKLVGAQELENNNELRKLEAEELFATTAISQPSSTSDLQTTTAVTPQSRQSDETILSQSPDLTARVKALEKIRNMLRAHVLRNLLTLLNDARSRQNMQTHADSPPAESQLIEDIVPAAAAASDCDCGTENDDVSTNDDDDKIITFDENLQRYVYKEKKDYDMMNSSESRLDYVMRI